MKIFEVIYTKKVEELTLPYGHPNTYYIKDDKVCFSIDINIETLKDIVECKDENVIKEKYNNDALTVLSIKNIGNKDYMFEAITPSDYISAKSTSNPISSVFYKQVDRPCTEEVQERFQKNGKVIPTTTYSEF